MRVATYNFCRGGADFDATYRILDRLQPDILFAQELLDPETYLTRGKQTWEALGFLPPIWHPVPTHGKWGSAIFLKEGSTTLVDVPHDLHGWVVGVTHSGVDFGDGKHHQIKLFSVHTPTKPELNYYIWQVQEILEYLKPHTEHANVLVGGDFNVTISHGRQARSEGETQLEAEIMTYMRRSLGLVNCWQTANPSQPVPRTYHSQESSTSHLDGIFISASLSPYLSASWVRGDSDHWTEGDHFPVIAEFDGNKPVFRPRVLRSSARPAEGQ